MDSPYKSKFMIISLVIIDIALILILVFYFSQPFFTACLNGTQCPSFDTLHIWIIDILIPLNFLILAVIAKRLKYSISRKNVAAIIFFLIWLWSIVEVLLVFLYYYTQPQCEPCIDGIPCPPCISIEQIWIRRLFIVNVIFLPILILTIVIISRKRLKK